ncbi:MAG: hypothetical protein QOI10_1563 [Solirubrobacterales bacterium]|nr:hypothetical protein [Solirubrobacterales bacterium]
MADLGSTSLASQIPGTEASGWRPTLDAVGDLSHRHHFLPQGAQRPFTDHRGKVAVVGTNGDRFETGPVNVGLERDLYLRVRPGGEKSDDIETVSLADIDDKAAPILQGLRERWPLSAEEKLRVATYVGVQLVRGPRWFEFHEGFTRDAYLKHLEAGDFRAKAEEHGLTEQEVYDAHVRAHIDDTPKLLTMLQTGAKAGSAIGSMTWCLLAFESPCLALADHPVSAWPIVSGGRFPGRVDPGTTGLINFLEVRLPVAPDLALLMAWADRPDIATPLSCGTHHARNLNAFSIAEAERHWVHRPGATARGGAGPWLPLSTELIDGYSPTAAVQSSMRQMISDDLNARLGDESREVRIRFIEQPGADLAA